MKKNLLVAILTVAAVAVGCGGDRHGADEQNIEDQGGISAEGWDHILTGTNRANVKISSIGSFDTSWTPCYRGASGQIKDGRAWRTIVQAVNAAVKMQPQEEEQCWPDAQDSLLFGDTKVVFKDKSSMNLIDAWSYRKICTQLPDAETAKTLSAALETVLKQAATEDCYRDRLE